MVLGTPWVTHPDRPRATWGAGKPSSCYFAQPESPRCTGVQQQGVAEGAHGRREHRHLGQLQARGLYQGLYAACLQTSPRQWLLRGCSRAQDKASLGGRSA